jgi:hypothetical protein
VTGGRKQRQAGAGARGEGFGWDAAQRWTAAKGRNRRGAAMRETTSWELRDDGSHHLHPDQHCDDVR